MGGEAAESRGFPGWLYMVAGELRGLLGSRGRPYTEWLGTCSEEPVCPGVDLLTLTS